ncbi:hypothetical protein D915_007613, partial [Fasciola hepatica]
MRVFSIILIVSLSSCHADDNPEPSYEQCLTVEERLQCEKMAIRRTAKRLHEPTGGFPSKILRTQLVDQCHLSPTCLYLQLQCVYSGMLKKKDGICGDGSW